MRTLAATTAWVCSCGSRSRFVFGREHGNGEPAGVDVLHRPVIGGAGRRVSFDEVEDSLHRRVVGGEGPPT